MRHRALQLGIWILARLVPEGDRQSLVGDLVEEYALRANEATSPAALKWCLQQVCTSVPPLLWARLARARWIPVAGVALLAYIAVGIVELIVNWAISRSAAYNPLGMLMTFPIVVLIGYCAARLRRGATIVLGAMMLLSVTVMTLTSPESLPLWYRIAYFVAGPLAVFIGTALRALGALRSLGRMEDGQA